MLVLSVSVISLTLSDAVKVMNPVITNNETHAGYQLTLVNTGDKLSTLSYKDASVNVQPLSSTTIEKTILKKNVLDTAIFKENIQFDGKNIYEINYKADKFRFNTKDSRWIVNEDTVKDEKEVFDNVYK